MDPVLTASEAAEGPTTATVFSGARGLATVCCDLTGINAVPPA
jgi:hypothetical protein